MTMDALWDRAVANNVHLAGLRPNGRFLSIQERFDEWMATEDGRIVAERIGREALDMRAHGWKHYGVKPLWEIARHDGNLRVGPNGGFKLNDHFTSRLARWLMAQYPELEDFFELRELRA